MVCLGCQQKMNVNSSYLGSSLVLKNSSVSCYQPKARSQRRIIQNSNTVSSVEQCWRAVCQCIKNKKCIEERGG